MCSPHHLLTQGRPPRQRLSMSWLTKTTQLESGTQAGFAELLLCSTSAFLSHPSHLAACFLFQKVVFVLILCSHSLHWASTFNPQLPKHLAALLSKPLPLHQPRAEAACALICHFADVGLTKLIFTGDWCRGGACKTKWNISCVKIMVFQEKGMEVAFAWCGVWP